MDATQWAGVSAFGAAALTCFALRRRAFLALGMINTCLAAECALGWRHRLHNFAIELMGAHYAERFWPQIGLIALALAALALFLRTMKAQRRRALRNPIALTGLALALFGIETISLHGVDRIFYASFGPVLLIGWAWILLGFSIAATAAAASRSRL